MDMMRKATRFGVLGALATLTCVSVILGAAQPAPASPAVPAAPDRGNQPGAAPAGGGGFMAGNFDPAQIQQMMDDNNRQTLGATPDEWKVLGPRFNKVQTLSRSLNGGVTGILGSFGMGRGGMGRGGMGRGGMGGMGGMMNGLTSILGEPTDLDKARDKLQAAIDKSAAAAGDNNATAELQAAIKAFRAAKVKIRQDLTAAENELRKVCSIQQEATLLAMGLLD
jgi:hypothetical protein